MLPPREFVALWLALCCTAHGNAKISSEVIALQQVLYDELQAVERGALITSLDASPDGNAFGQLRRVFHEFERQNQDSITAILRVLALVDHTLENTIKDCAKIFDLPSLESENVLFRDITRPLLLRVAQLCQQITSEDLTCLEATMEAVEEEANGYRKRLDAARANMQTVLEQIDSEAATVSMVSRLDAILNRMKLQNSSIQQAIMTAAGKFLDTQRSIGVTILDAISPNSDDNEDALAVTSFTAFLENTTSVLEDDLAEQLEAWFNQTENTLYMIAEEMKAILHNLVESPVVAFLERQNSLQCLAEYYKNFALQNVLIGLENIFECFHVADDMERIFGTVTLLLGLAEGQVKDIYQGLLNCYQTGATRNVASSEMMSCFEVATLILDATEEFVEAKMNEIFFHAEDTLNFEELKMEACLYYKAREVMQNEEFINLRYLKCNEVDVSTVYVPAEGQFVPV